MIPDLISYILMIIGGLCILAFLFLTGMMIAEHYYDKRKARQINTPADTDFDKIWGWNDADRH